jgi:polysaccharide chain length determinant protein (PEP-CTERM system associated)
MSPDDHQLSLSDYLAILKRRALLIVATFGGVFAVAVAVALLIPPVYQSTGTIMIESQQIPNDLVQATVTSYADERIEIIKQRVMTRENLLRIIDKYQLFKDRGLTFTPSEQIDEMRQLIGVQLVNANLRQGQRGSATIAFRVSFEHRRPDIAQRVANELVTLFLSENVKVRSERATQTTEFLTQEANKLKAELDALETQIASYKQQNGAALPQNMTLSMNAIQRLEGELRDTERDYRAAEEEARYLEVELAGAKAAVTNAAALVGGGSPAATADTAEAELQKARALLARMATTYTDNHPDVRATKRRIEALEKALAEANNAPAASTPAAVPGGSKSPTVAAAELVVAKVESRLVAARSRMQLLQTQQASLRGRLAQAEGQLLQAPQVERGLAALMRDHDGAKRKYEEIHAKQMTAQVAENLEGDQKAERFSLLEPPLTPDRPIKPDRKKMIALGFVLAGVAAAGLVMLLETLHGTVRGADAVAAITGHRPLVLVPYITIAQESAQRRKLLLRLLGAAVALFLVALLAVHFLYMPLDVLIVKVMLRLS